MTNNMTAKKEGKSMQRKNGFAVFKEGPGSMSPLFIGSKTECLRFMAYVLREEPHKGLTIRRHFD